MVEVIRPSEVPTSRNPRGEEVRFLVDREPVSVVMLTLPPEGRVPMHKTPVDVLFYVAGGEGEVHIGDDSAQVRTGDIIVSPAEIPHGLNASENSKLEVLIIKTPNPKRPTS